MINFNQKTPYDTYDYDQLMLTCQTCTACDLSSHRTQVVVGHGPVPCQLMIIGEGPGQEEDIQGKPFVGRSGQLLTQILESVGINRETDAYIANTVKCRPPGNRTPLPREIESCLPYLMRQIQLVQPRILLLLGNPSLKTFLGKKLGITKSRGNWFKAPVNYMTDSLYIMPLFHPSYLLRNPSAKTGGPKWLTQEDARNVKSILSMAAVN